MQDWTVTDEVQRWSVFPLDFCCQPWSGRWSYALVRGPSFNLPRAQWCTSNQFRTGPPGSLRIVLEVFSHWHTTQMMTSPTSSAWRVEPVYVIIWVVCLWLRWHGDDVPHRGVLSYQQTGRPWPLPSSLCCWWNCCSVAERTSHVTHTTTTTTLNTGWRDVTESMVTIRSPFCGHNTT